MPRDSFSESDMYDPLKRFFVSMGYTVNGEVCGCDFVAARETDLIIIEMKKSFSLRLVFQAMDRQKIGGQVYMAVPRPESARAKAFRQQVELAKRLGLGLITVAMDSAYKSVEVLCFPPLDDNAKRPHLRKLLVNEASARSMDLNIGGSRGRKLMTAFRERSIRIAAALEYGGPSRAADLIRRFGCCNGTYNMLRANHYGWFEKTDKGVYGLSEAGRIMLISGEFGPMVEFQRAEIQKAGKEET
jgi:hypothetical protein